MNSDAKKEIEKIQRYVSNCIREWKQKLDTRLIESEYQSYLAKHAGLFLATNIHDALVISKLKLGSEFETDFVIVRDDFSHGLRYTLIEVEVPHVDKLFTETQKPCDRLNTALAQVNSWRKWLMQHRVELSELLPSKAMRHGGPPNLEFMIVIGRRDREDCKNEKYEDVDRIWASDFHGIRIRSFDFLTSNATRRFCEYFNTFTEEHVRQLSAYPSFAHNNLNNLDWAALSHSEWRQLIRSGKFEDSHLLERNWEILLKSREKPERKK